VSATTTRVPLAEARAIAEELAELLRPACLRLEIAGSIRRGMATIGDVDLLCEPKTEPILDMFDAPTGEVIDLLDARCEELLALDELAQRLDRNGRRAWGRKLKRAVYRGLGVDIRACTDPAAWGAWLVISTGPADFNKALVTPRAQGGRLPPGFEWKRDAGFHLYRYGGRVETPDEESVFAALGLPFMDPEDRR
jgi:DNA polymerase/3'-5' exonuclease PolX